MTQKIRTIKRTPKMPLAASYRITSGVENFYLDTRPVLHQGWSAYEMRSLRRIVDPPEKPKRKMIRVWYFDDPLGGLIWFDEAVLRRRHADAVSAKHNPGPIESALIPAPRRKGKAT